MGALIGHSEYAREACGGASSYGWICEVCRVDREPSGRIPEHAGESVTEWHESIPHL